MIPIHDSHEQKTVLHVAQYVANKHIGIDVKPRPNDRNMSTQHIATYVACVAMGFVNCQLWANNPQHVAKCCNRMANNVAIVWPGLYNYRRRLTTKIKVSASAWNSRKLSQNFAVNSPPKNKRWFAISHEQNSSFHIKLTSCKHRHRYYGHHSNFRTANFYIKIFWKRAWSPTVEEFRKISRMTWFARDSKLQPIKSHHFSGRARDTGKFKKTRQFLTPKKTKGMRFRI